MVIEKINSLFVKQSLGYVLIGPGRWGSSDPWLGIPVGWGDIAGAKAIVEASFPARGVEMSQGSHFFQNLTSFSIGYFTVNTTNKFNKLDWEWLYKQKIIEQKEFVKHIRLKKPLTIKMNAHENIGVILKP